MSTSRHPGKRRKRLTEEAPYCHWCDQKVYFYVPGPGENMPDSAATLDHYYAKGDKRRETNESPSVLSCYRCNQKRGNTKSEEFGNKLEINQKLGKRLNKNSPLTSTIYDLITPEIREKLKW